MSNISLRIHEATNEMTYMGIEINKHRTESESRSNESESEFNDFNPKNIWFYNTILFISVIRTQGEQNDKYFFSRLP